MTSPGRPNATTFEMVVDAVLPVPGRGLVVGGLLLAGRRPGPGATVAVSTPGGAHAVGRVLGAASFDKPTRLADARTGDRQVDLLLDAVTPEDVPPGSTIVEVPSSWSPARRPSDRVADLGP